MKILLVEDHCPTASFIVKGLKEAGINAKTVADGAAALDTMISEDFDCIILDIMLPKIDGVTLLKTFRASNKATPVLMLTAKDTVEDKVAGLASGADDYLVKPFAFSELLARLNAITRRAASRAPQPTLVIEDLNIDSIRHTVTRGGKTIDLTKKEFSLLWLLASHKEEVLSRTYISERVWDINFESDTNTVDVAVKRLRTKVDDGFDRKLIHTIRGIGYVLR
ncbi:two-component system copper resistance phosphate regulon response regulator CusR [Elusimicrobium simillimum]|uniref:heavy metal response regulator transcription factor n=1 Tax=Elusimicrobium simillimum TaxID=3143438 RepID=UPI003C6EF801